MSPRRNRIDPWSDLHAASGRGLFTGNRGCLVDDRGTRRAPPRQSAVDRVRDRVQGLAASPRRPAPMDADLLPRRRRRAGGRPPALRVLPAGRLPVVPRRGEHVGGVSRNRCSRPSSIGGSSLSATAAVGAWTAPLTAWCGRRASTTCRPARSSWTPIVGPGCWSTTGCSPSRSTDGRSRSTARRAARSKS